MKEIILIGLLVLLIALFLRSVLWKNIRVKLFYDTRVSIKEDERYLTTKLRNKLTVYDRQNNILMIADHSRTINEWNTYFAKHKPKTIKDIIFYRQYLNFITFIN